MKTGTVTRAELEARTAAYYAGFRRGVPTLTEWYSAVHIAFQVVGEANGLNLTETRILVAVCETGAANTWELEEALLLQGSQVRRAIVPLVEADMVVASDVYGGRVRRGVRMLLSATEQGVAVANNVASHAQKVLTL